MGEIAVFLGAEGIQRVKSQFFDEEFESKFSLRSPGPVGVLPHTFWKVVCIVKTNFVLNVCAYHWFDI